jgi:hypothetical protein
VARVKRQRIEAGQPLVMADRKSFLNNLKNLHLVLSVALEHVQANRNQFVKDATTNQLRHFERSITQIRILAGQLEREFNTIEYLIFKRPPNSVS